MSTLEELMDRLSPEDRAEVERRAQDLILETGLSMLREEMRLSQEDVANALDVSQPAVAQIEKRGNDLKIATLKRYIESIGGHLSLTVDMPNGEVRTFRL